MFKIAIGLVIGTIIGTFVTIILVAIAMQDEDNKKSE